MKGYTKCERWHIFHGLNNWHILRIHKTKTKTPALDSIADAEFDEAQDVAVTKPLQITSKTSYVPSLPLCCCTFVVGSNILVVWGANIKVYMIRYWKKLKLACSHT